MYSLLSSSTVPMLPSSRPPSFYHQKNIW
jgi:hypothetical protein